MSVNSEQSSIQINNSTRNQIIQQNQLFIEDLDESLKNNLSFDNTSNRDNTQPPKESPLQQSSPPYQPHSLCYNQDNSLSNTYSQIERLNSNAITTYVNSLNQRIQTLSNENEELKLNFVQVSEMLENEREATHSTQSKQTSHYQSEIKLLQTSNELLQKEKQRQLEQNSIEKEQFEIQIANIKMENEQLTSRVKKLKEENDALRKENFDINIRLMEANKVRYENETLKEEITQLTLNRLSMKDDISDMRSKSNDRSNSTDKASKEKAKPKPKNANVIVKSSNKTHKDNPNEKEIVPHQTVNEQKVVNSDLKKVMVQRNKYKMTSYEKQNTGQSKPLTPKRHHKNQKYQQLREETDENNNFNENVKLLKKAYNDYVIRLNAKEFQDLEEEEDLKAKMRMIMETIESQRDQGSRQHLSQ